MITWFQIGYMDREGFARPKTEEQITEWLAGRRAWTEINK